MELRIEYNIDTNNFVTSCLSSMIDFLSRTSEYVLYVPLSNFNNAKYFVVHSISNDLYLIFVGANNRVGLMVSTEFNNNVNIFYQKNIVYAMQSDSGGSYLSVPMPTISVCNKLVANYNSEGFSVMFSGLDLMQYNFISHITTQYCTFNMCFGNLVKYGSWDNHGGFWYGGDCITYCRVSANCSFAERSNNRFECFLRIDMDNAINRPVLSKNFFDQSYKSIVNGNKIWASTFLYGASDNIAFNYVPMVISVDNSDKGLPTYWSIFPQTQFEKGHTSNDLNKVSIIMRLYFMVQRDPSVLNEYSCVGYTNIINFVNMYNMSTNRVINGTFPVKLAYYNCFQCSTRRSAWGFNGYCGLAFKMEEQNNE